MKHISLKNIKNFLCATLSLLLIPALSACTTTNKDPEEYFYSVFELLCAEEGRFDSVGTAFKCNDFVYTNAHIVSCTKEQEKAIYDTITGYVYKSFEKVVFKVININYEKDIAILVPVENSEIYNKLPSLSFAVNEDIKIGQSISTVGNLNGYGLSWNRGFISSKPKLIERNGIESYYLQTSIEISKGSSGGPVLKDSGKVIGMMSFKVRDANGEYVDGMSFAIPADELINFKNNYSLPAPEAARG